MSKAIYKYILKPDTEQQILVSEDHTILSAAVQREEICVWALIDPDQEQDHTIWIHSFTTGAEFDESIPKNTKFLGTCLLNNGSLVFHVFAERKA